MYPQKWGKSRNLPLLPFLLPMSPSYKYKLSLMAISMIEMCKVLSSESVISTQEGYVPRWKVFAITHDKHAPIQGLLHHLMYNQIIKYDRLVSGKAIYNGTDEQHEWIVSGPDREVSGKGFITCKSLDDAKKVLRYFQKYLGRERRATNIALYSSYRTGLTIRTVFVKNITYKDKILLHRNLCFHEYGGPLDIHEEIECERYKDMRILDTCWANP